MCFLLQDNDLKQYLDNCGNLMSVHNVKVSRCCLGPCPPASPRPQSRVLQGWVRLDTPSLFSSAFLLFFELFQPALMLHQLFSSHCHPK